MNEAELNLVVAADEIDDITGRVGQYSDCTTLNERRQRRIDVDLTLWNCEHHVNSPLGHLLRQLTN